MQHSDTKTLKAITVAEEFAALTGPWAPCDITTVNDTVLRAVRLEGKFIWHQHDEEDELFYVISGSMVMHLENQPGVPLQAGQCLCVPRGTRHCPESETGAEVILIEPITTIRTGSH